MVLEGCVWKKAQNRATASDDKVQAGFVQPIPSYRYLGDHVLGAEVGGLYRIIYS